MATFEDCAENWVNHSRQKQPGWEREKNESDTSDKSSQFLLTWLKDKRKENEDGVVQEKEREKVRKASRELVANERGGEGGVEKKSPEKRGW